MRYGSPRGRKHHGRTEQRRIVPSLPFHVAPSCHEPIEPEHVSSANDALDMIERCVWKLLDASGECALRRRVEKLLSL